MQCRFSAFTCKGASGRQLPDVCRAVYFYDHRLARPATPTAARRWKLLITGSDSERSHWSNKLRSDGHPEHAIAVLLEVSDSCDHFFIQQTDIFYLDLPAHECGGRILERLFTRDPSFTEKRLLEG